MVEEEIESVENILVRAETGERTVNGRDASTASAVLPDRIKTTSNGGGRHRKRLIYIYN